MGLGPACSTICDPRNIPLCAIPLCVFLGALSSHITDTGLPKANKPHLFKNIMVFFWACRRRRQGQKTNMFLTMCGFLALVPQASKNHWVKKTLRDPFDVFVAPILPLPARAFAQHRILCYAIVLPGRNSWSPALISARFKSGKPQIRSSGQPKDRF